MIISSRPVIGNEQLSQIGGQAPCVMLFDTKTCPSVRFDLAEQGYKPVQIARTLNIDGVPSPKEHKKRIGLLKRTEGESITFWNGTTVSKIISDEQYIGNLVFGKRRVVEVGKNKCKHMPKSKWVISENTIPAIINEEQFKTVNMIATKGKRAQAEADK